MEAMFVASIRYGLVEGLDGTNGVGTAVGATVGTAVGAFFFDDFFGNFLGMLLPKELFAYATKTRTVRAGNFMIDG